MSERLPEISQNHKFGVLGTHDLKEKMVSKGVPFERECRVFEVCNPHQAQKVLSSAMEVSTALPCRISVYEEDGKTILATIKPTSLLTLFDIDNAEQTAKEVEDTLILIMKETAAAS
ncbi:conserved domain protein [Verrucomicrobiia bacterium DG1235]|nr:conserved domain protein [Verrucomicrobiae bacterium DG1235]